jgi:hypothetical protein
MLIALLQAMHDSANAAVRQVDPQVMGMRARRSRAKVVG